MTMIEKASALFTGERPPSPLGTIHVVDKNPLNWLYVLYNCAEESVRVNTDGYVEPAAMEAYRWIDDLTLEVDIREGNHFPDGEAVTAAVVKRSFDELMHWRAPHPPGSHFNHDPRTRCEIVGNHRVRFHLPEPDGTALGKLRAMHVMSTRFWDELGFGYKRTGMGEGHW
jgi:ABC-type transport system substrate-binding protein